MKCIYFGTIAFIFSLLLTLQTTVLNSVSPYLTLVITLALLYLAINTKKELWRSICMIIFFAFLGISSGLRVGPSAEAILEPFFGKEVVLVGHVEPLSIKYGPQYSSMQLQCEHLQQGSQVITYKGKVRLSLADTGVKSSNTVYTKSLYHDILEEQKLSRFSKAFLTKRIIVCGKLEPLTAFHNPGGFDSKLYNRINDIGGRLRNTKLIQNADISINNLDEPYSFWQRLRNKLAIYNLNLREQMQRLMGERSGKLLGSMLLGGSTDVDEDIRDVFTANGLSHLLSVSGTHLLLLASLLALLVQPLPKPLRKPLVGLLLLLYALLCGLRPPVLRALCMSLVVLWGRRDADDREQRTESYQKIVGFFDNKLERGYLLCLVAMGMLLLKPIWLLDIGFQLSFGAAAGLLWFMPPCQRLMAKLMPDFLAEGFAITLAAQLGVLPILAGNFHQLSLVSLISNLILVPVLEVAAFLASFGLFLSHIPTGIIDGLGRLLSQTTSYLIDQLLVQAEFLAALPFSQFVIPSLPFWCMLIYYAALLVWADVPILQFISNTERRFFILCSSLALVVALLWQQYTPKPLTIYFLDVAQGDCVVIETPRREVYIYDTGGIQGLDTGKRIVAPFLRSLGRNSVDGLILSHYDYDHVGGAVGLLQQLQVRELVLPQEHLDEVGGTMHEAITLAAQKANTRITFAKMERSWQLGAGAVMSLLTPNTLFSNSMVQNEAWQHSSGVSSSTIALKPKLETGVSGNDASTILALRSPQGSLLLTGDLGSEVEEQLELEDFTVFKAGHHGSKFSNSEKFLQRLQPQITVISCGANNRYGHPHQETLGRLQDIGSKVYRTDLQGCIKVVFDENGPRCYSYIYDRF